MNISECIHDNYEDDVSDAWNAGRDVIAIGCHKTACLYNSVRILLTKWKGTDIWESGLLGRPQKQTLSKSHYKHSESMSLSISPQIAPMSLDLVTRSHRIFLPKKFAWYALSCDMEIDIDFFSHHVCHTPRRKKTDNPKRNGVWQTWYRLRMFIDILRETLEKYLNDVWSQVLWTFRSNYQKRSIFGRCSQIYRLMKISNYLMDE